MVLEFRTPSKKNLELEGRRSGNHLLKNHRLTSRRKMTITLATWMKQRKVKKILRLMIKQLTTN